MNPPARSPLRRFLAALLFAALFLGVAWYALGPGADSDRAASAPDAVAAVVGDAPDELRASAALEVPLEAPVELAPSAEGTRQAAHVTEEPEPAKAPVALAELRGRLVRLDGSPATGVALEVRGWGGNPERLLKYGKPTDWVNPEGTTDDDGRFSFHFDPPPAYVFVLNATQAGLAKLSWRWSSLPPRQVTDVGEVVMAPGGSVRGRVVDERGNPVTGSWHVNGAADSDGLPNGRTATMVQSPVDPTGEFLLEGLPAGRVQLFANSSLSGGVVGPEVVVRAGAETLADVVHRGPDDSRVIRVNMVNRIMHIFGSPAPGTIVLSDAQGRRIAENSRVPMHVWTFDNLEPGVYDVSIEDPRFEPWRQSGVQTGTAVSANLVGSAAVQLTVQDPSGNRLDDYQLRLRFLKANFGPSEFELRALGTPAPTGGVYRGLMPIPPKAPEVPPLDQAGRTRDEQRAALEARLARVSVIEPVPFELVAVAPGIGAGSQEVSTLAPGETAVVTITLEPQSTVRGTIVGVEPSQVDGVTVVLADAVHDADWAVAHSGSMGRIDGTTELRLGTRADPVGAFDFGAVPLGSYRLLARFHNEFYGEYGPFELVPGQNADVEIQVPAQGAIEGRILAHPDDLRFAWVEARGREDYMPNKIQWHQFDTAPPPRAAVAADGRFRIAPLRSGTYALVLHHGSTAPQGDTWRWTSRFSVGVPLGAVELPRPQVVSAEFDLTQQRRGVIHCVATVDGQPAVGWTVRAHSPSDSDPQRVRETWNTTDTAGRTILELLESGDWTVGLVSHDRVWCVRTAVPETLPPGGEIHVRIDVTLHPGTLQILDAKTGAPRANEWIGWKDGDQAATLETDAQGRLELKLPAATYTISTRGKEFAVEWTNSGPVPAEIRL